MTKRGESNGPLVRQARAALQVSARSAAKLARGNAAAVAAAAEVLVQCFENGGTVYFCGNGGSAADAQHLAAEFSGRYLIERPGLPAIALSTNTSALTAIGNDYGYDQVFSRQLEGLGAPGDVLVAITTSGRSESVRHAVAGAQALGMTVIGMTGAKGAEFAALCDVALVTPSASTPNIQEGHITMGHAFCLLVERALFPPAPTRSVARSGARAKAARPLSVARSGARAKAARPRSVARSGARAKAAVRPRSRAGAR